MEHHGRQQEADALGTTVDSSRQPACLSGQVEVEVESEQVLKDVARNFADGFLGHTRKDCVPEFLEERGSDSGGAVCLVR